MKGALAKCGMLAAENGTAELCRDYLQLVRIRVVLPSDDVAQVLVDYLARCGITYTPPAQEWETT
jgi:hypothetical protein